MKFNNYWTKEINDLYREMIRENKSMDDIINHFGRDLLNHHPNKKFHRDGKMFPYKDFVNEIKITPGEIEYEIDIKESEMFNQGKDYLLSFNINDVDYIIILFYYIVNDVVSFNVLFTTKEQYDEYIKIKGDKKYGELSIEEFNDISEILERETNYGVIIKIMKSISFILINFHNILKYSYDIPYSICETNNPVKIRLYRNIIEQSFINIKETEDIMYNGMKIYYYYIN